MVIDDILQESTEYYLGRKIQAIGAILLTPPGSPCLRRRGGQGYWYLRRYAGGNRRSEAYLGREHAPGLQPRLERIRRRKERIASLKQDKRALRKFGVKRVEAERENFQPVIKDLFKALEEEGLWELGFEIVGSWCFIIYQNYCGVEPYPLRTLDVDIAVSLPFVQRTVEAILGAARTGAVGDGKIFVTPLEQVYRIRTGERDVAAVTPGERAITAAAV